MIKKSKSGSGLLASLGMLLLVASNAFAEPTISIGEISLPDDGNWYEVQTADTYITLCEGVLVCQLRAGYYNVIDHTNGIRFTNLYVGGRPQSGSPPSYQVDGSSVQFFYDGYYTVTSLRTNEIVCEGTAALFEPLMCDVDSGLYDFSYVSEDGVTREFKNVPIPTPYSIDASTVEFNVPGWFQIQDIETYANLCEGPATAESPLVCEMEPGRYNFTYISTDTAERPILLDYGQSLRFEDVRLYNQ